LIRPVGIANDPRLQRGTRGEHDRTESGAEREVPIGIRRSLATAVEEVLPLLGIRVAAGSNPHFPARLRRVFRKSLPELSDQPPGSPSRRGVCSGEHADGVGEPERPHHRGRILDVTARNEMLEQRKTGIVEREIE
jgi:hypothetical protein